MKKIKFYFDVMIIRIHDFISRVTERKAARK